MEIDNTIATDELYNKRFDLIHNLHEAEKAFNNTAELDNEWAKCESACRSLTVTCTINGRPTSISVDDKTAELILAMINKHFLDNVANFEHEVEETFTQN